MSSSNTNEQVKDHGDYTREQFDEERRNVTISQMQDAAKQPGSYQTYRPDGPNLPIAGKSSERKDSSRQQDTESMPGATKAIDGPDDSATGGTLRVVRPEDPHKEGFIYGKLTPKKKSSDDPNI